MSIDVDREFTGYLIKKSNEKEEDPFIKTISLDVLPRAEACQPQ